MVLVSEGANGRQGAQATTAGVADELLGRADTLHQHLLETIIAGGTLGDLCEGITRHVEAAVFALTTDGRVLTSSGETPDIDAAERFGCFDKTGRFLVENEPVGPRSDHTDPHWHHRMVVRICAGSHDLGRLVAVSGQRAMGSSELHLLERAARIAALALTKDIEVATVEGKYRAEFLRDVLIGRGGGQASAVIHANALGWDITGPLVVVVAEIDTDDEKAGLEVAQVEAVHQRFASAWVRVVQLRSSLAPCVGFGNREVVTLLPVLPTSSSEPDDAGTLRLIREIVHAVRGAGGGGRRSFSTGVSRVASSVDDIPRAYEDAWAAVTIGRRIHGDGALQRFNDLGVFRVLALVPDGPDLDRFVDEVLGPLASDESQDAADLRRTLGALLDTDLNLAETARQLHYHYNTVRYRVAKLERTVGAFTHDPELRLSLRLALKIVEMRDR